MIESVSALSSLPRRADHQIILDALTTSPTSSDFPPSPSWLHSRQHLIAERTPSLIISRSVERSIDHKAAKQSLLRELVDASCPTAFLEECQAKDTFRNNLAEDCDDEKRNPACGSSLSLDNGSVHRIRQSLNQKRTSWQQLALRGRQEAHNHKMTLTSLKEAAKRAQKETRSQGKDKDVEELSLALLQQARGKVQAKSTSINTMRGVDAPEGFARPSRPIVGTCSKAKCSYKTRSVQHQKQHAVEAITFRPKLHQRQTSDISMSEFGNSTHHGSYSRASRSVLEEGFEHDDDDGFADDTTTEKMIDQHAAEARLTNFVGSTASSTDDDANSFEVASLADPFLEEDENDDEIYAKTPVEKYHFSAGAMEVLGDLGRGPTSLPQGATESTPMSCFYLSLGSISSRWNCSSSPALAAPPAEQVVALDQFLASKAATSSFLPARKPPRKLSPMVPMIKSKTIQHHDKDDRNNNNNNDASMSSIQSSESCPPILPLRKISAHNEEQFGPEKLSNSCTMLPSSAFAQRDDGWTNRRNIPLNDHGRDCALPQIPLRKCSMHGGASGVSVSDTIRRTGKLSTSSCRSSSMAMQHHKTNNNTITGVSQFSPTTNTDAWSPQIPLRKPSVKQDSNVPLPPETDGSPRSINTDLYD